jgi:LysM repeat protein
MIRKVFILCVLAITLLMALPAAAQNFVLHTVTAADANGGLSKIARQYCTDWQTIYALNSKIIGPNPNIIRAGQVLTVPNNCPGAPGQTGVFDRGPRAFANGFVVSPNLYVPAQGDTLTSIAARFGVTTDAIITANNIRNPNRIIAGQPLIIPGLNVGSVPPPQPTPPPPPTFPTNPLPIFLQPNCIITFFGSTPVATAVNTNPTVVLPAGEFPSLVAFETLGGITYQLTNGFFVSTNWATFGTTPSCNV